MIQITGNNGDWWYWWYRIITGANVGKSEMWYKDYSEIREYDGKRKQGGHFYSPLYMVNINERMIWTGTVLWQLASIAQTC